MDRLVRLWRDGERDDFGEGDEMGLADRINEEGEEKEERVMVIVIEAWDYGLWVTGVWLEKLNIGMKPNEI